MNRTPDLEILKKNFKEMIKEFEKPEDEEKKPKKEKALMVVMGLESRYLNSFFLIAEDHNCADIVYHSNPINQNLFDAMRAAKDAEQMTIDLILVISRKIFDEFKILIEKYCDNFLNNIIYVMSEQHESPLQTSCKNIKEFYFIEVLEAIGDRMAVYPPENITKTLEALKNNGVASKEK